MRRRRRRVVGLIPRAGRAWGRWFRGILGHPQPILFVGASLCLIGALWVFAQQSPVFRVARVQFPEHSTLTVRSPVLGQNIWHVNIRILAEELHQQQPWLKAVRVTRQLPDTLFIEPVERRAVAQVRLDRWYPVDREGFILPAGSGSPVDGLTRLTGVEHPGANLRAGKANADDRLQLALRVLQTAQHAPSLALRKVTEVNVADPQQIRFLVNGDTEIRCGGETELEAHLRRLQTAWNAIAKQSIAVRYIDVRFSEPVVAPRT